MRPGRPLRFLGQVFGGWVLVRVVLAGPQPGELPTTLHELPQPSRRADGIGAAAPGGASLPERQGRVAGKGSVPVAAQAPPPGFAAFPALARLPLALVQGPGVGLGGVVPPQPATGAGGGIRLADRKEKLSRFQASAWLLARSGGIGLPGTGQLGGGQAGLRLRYALAGQRLGAVARLATPLEGKGREVAFGIEWRPGGGPVAVVAEQRIGLDGTHGGPALGIVSGVSGLRLPAGFSIEGYGQAGVVQRDRTEPYLDAGLRAARPVAAIGRARLDLGLGAWGAAQRDAARLDIGPSAAIALPLGQKTIRLTLEWRERIAGKARPGSGPALTIGSDF